MHVLFESQYLPPITTFSFIKKATATTIDLHSYYQKKSYRNRCHICGANGLQRLSVPLSKGKNQKSLLYSVGINYDEDWQKDHWQSFVSAYGRSAFFDYYRDDFEKILFTKFKTLAELNTKLFNWLLEEIGMNEQTHFTTNYVEKEQSFYIDLRNKITPNYHEKNSFDLPLKNKKLIYQQVFSNKYEFIPNLSIIDLLFTQGPNAYSYL